MFDWNKITPGEMYLACMQIAFTCERCGKCCTGMNGIALNSLDTARMAKATGLDKNDFIRTYTIASDKLKSDRWYKPVGEDKKCPFLGETGCEHYEGRGQVCRHYPFFSNIMVERIKKEKRFTIFPQCKGMTNAFVGILTQALAMDRVEASNILKSDVGKFAWLHMMVSEGREKTVDNIIKDMGYANLPEQDYLKPMCWVYAVAMWASMGERHIQNALQEVYRYV